MRVYVTAALQIELDDESWRCDRCDHELGSARKSYKEGCLVTARDPAEVHDPIIDKDRYEFTFAPDPKWCALLEYCCPHCGHLIEVEYLPPGHPPAHDIELDIDALKAQWSKREALDGPVLGPDTGSPNMGHHHH